MSKTPIENIALVGFMATGKSAVGRNLARKLHRRFVDLDALIEKTEGRNVRDIFAEKGESYFRRLEKQALEQILSQQGQIIATGGGIILDEDNLTLLRQKSLLIGLTASTDVLVSRVGKNSKRPLLKGVDVRARIEELLQQRQSRYAEADVIIDTSGLTINQVVEKILKVVRSE
ncbi:MAG TPA: shikimate kinase, partial [Candidatus Binatia bacterium]|nr:shikimate kinase [Candidatus Binatia bacterium]